MSQSPPSNVPKGRVWWGCGLVAALAVTVLTFLLWHYRLEDVKALVSANETRCEITARKVSAWQDRWIAPGLSATDVAYPLSVYIFAGGCAGLPDGKPYDVELIAPENGRIVARGKACGARPEKDFPCRIEAPPIPTRAASHRFILRVTRSPGEVATAKLEIGLTHEWRSAVIDAILSV